jgi:glycine cleavage system H protein
LNPEQLRYAKTHEWVQLDLEGDGKIATVGLSKFAVEALTDLVYIELPKVGAAVKAGESFAEIESVKAVSDIYSPVTGEVIAANDNLPDHLETLNEDPYGEGWIAKIRITDDAASELMDFDTYQRQLAEEEDG